MWFFSAPFCIIASVSFGIHDATILVSQIKNNINKMRKEKQFAARKSSIISKDCIHDAERRKIV